MAFALALPRASSRGYWVRLAAAALASYFVCVLVVALVADRTLISNFAHHGLRVQPEWRTEVSQAVIGQLWAITTVGFPLFVILLLAPELASLLVPTEATLLDRQRANPWEAWLGSSATRR